MKGIIMIAFGCIFCISAFAKKHVSVASRKKVAKDTVVMNFKVCKNDAGYTICGQAPSAQNSTYSLPVYRSFHAPAYEPDRGVLIVLPGITEVPKVKFPYDKVGPTAESWEFTNTSPGDGMW